MKTANLVLVRRLGILAGVAGTLAMACASEQTTKPTTTSALLVTPNDAAAARIAKVRCDREMRCNNIGPEKKFKDGPSCEREVLQNVSSDLRTSSCPRVSSDRLDKCVDETSHQGCGDPFDAIARLAACRRGELCID